MGIDPKKINLAQVVEAIEGPITINDCVLNKKNCRFSGKCKARKCLTGVRSKIQAMLAATTISDLALQY